MKDTELVAEVFKRAENYFEEQKKLCAITELEKIKAELEKTYPMNGYGIPSSRATGKSVGYGIHIALEIIDNHIAELKGDKCDNDHDCEHCDWVECPN